ncbi:hypothetical protein A8990_15419 [Paenibacillus taihuensis]|uniref:Uncharacterized protein n=1 Tax=Paenibacillus taihuensis TaxID=1156355 RepID=A0A3D9Q9S0_9BACL|nr:hypothetical protein A8990_15419 [Paenibacillus taihuensis]
MRLQRGHIRALCSRSGKEKRLHEVQRGRAAELESANATHPPSAPAEPTSGAVTMFGEAEG